MLTNILESLDKEIDRLNDFIVHLSKENHRLTEENKMLRTMLGNAVTETVKCHDDMGNVVTVKVN